MAVLTATLHDRSTIEVVALGDGPTVVMPVKTTRVDAETADQMRAWGAEPDAGVTITSGLADAGFRVITADLEGHRMAHPAARTLTPDAMSDDILAIADAAGAETFAYSGYSWLGLSGLQLAIRTPRLWALAMGGFPPIDGPYSEMLAVTRAAHALSSSHRQDDPQAVVEPGDWDSVQVQSDEAQTGQFVTLYESLQGFDDADARRRLTVPRLAYAGARDEIVYAPQWGGVTVRIAAPLVTHRTVLETEGWTVEVLPDRDHLAAMHSDVVLPLLTSWLQAVRRSAPVV